MRVCSFVNRHLYCQIPAVGPWVCDQLLIARRRSLVAGPVVKPHIPIYPTMILLSFAFAAAWTVTSAMAAHPPRIVEAFGATPAQAVFAGMLIGPAQVAARVFEASTLSRFHPLFSTRLACITHPIGACVIGIFGGGAAARNAAIVDLRSGEICLPAGAHRSALAYRPGGGSAGVRAANRAARALDGHGIFVVEPGGLGGLGAAAARASSSRRGRITGEVRFWSGCVRAAQSCCRRVMEQASCCRSDARRQNQSSAEHYLGNRGEGRRIHVTPLDEGDGGDSIAVNELAIRCRADACSLPSAALLLARLRLLGR